MLFRNIDLKKTYYILCIILSCLSIHAQESEAKEFTVQLDSSVSRIRYQPDFIYCETLFDSKKKVQIHYSLCKKSLKKFYVTDSCSLGETAEYDYKIRNDQTINGGMGHSIVPCLIYTDEDYKEIVSEKYHYKSEDIQKFCLDLFDRIEVTKKAIFLD